MVLHMSDPIKFLAHNMVSRKKARADPYILFLGAGASINSGCSSLMKIVDDVLKSQATKSDLDYWEDKIKKANQDKEYEKFLNEKIGREKCTCFFETWEKLGDNTRYSILKKHLLENKNPSEGYDYLVQLIRNGFIKMVFSTNLDNLLVHRFLINSSFFIS